MRSPWILSLAVLLACSAARANETEIACAVSHPETGRLHAVVRFHRALAAYRICDRLGTLRAPAETEAKVWARVRGRQLERTMDVALEGTFRSGARILFPRRTVDRIRALCHHRPGRGCESHGSRRGTIFVDAAYTGRRESGTAEHPYRTIGKGIAAASAGQRVVVRPGLYAESVVMKDGVDLEGAGAGACVIDGGYAGSAVTAARSRLSGFTIQGGSGTRHPWSEMLWLGGGVYCRSAAATVERCVLRDHLRLDGGYLQGGAVGAFEARVDLLRCVAYDSYADAGSGFYQEGPSADGASRVLHCTFARCRVMGHLYFASVVFTDSPHDVRNCILAESDGDIRLGGSTEPSIRYNLFHQIRRSSGWEARFPENIDADPLFLDAGANDFRLADGSPCIDAGDPDPALSDPDGSRADIGAFPKGGW